MAGLQEGRPEEEILQILKNLLLEDLILIGEVVDALGKVPDPRIGRILQQLHDGSSDKKLRKGIRKSLYRLKSKGVFIEEVSSSQEKPVFKPLPAEPPRGWMGPFDFFGHRFLILVVSHPGRGMSVLQGVISDTKGILNFKGWEMPRKRFKEFFEEVREKNLFPLVEIDPAYLCFLLSQAYRLSHDRGSLLPQDYLLWKKEIDALQQDYDRNPVYSLLEMDDVEGDDRLLEKSGDLLKMDLFSDWGVEESEIQPYAEEVWEAEESKLILNRAQKEARFREIYQRALSELFPEQRRSLYCKRMEEMAFYLLKLGKEDEARMSLAVAIDLKKPPITIRPNPFLFQLVVRSIQTLLQEAYKERREAFSLIQKP